MIDGKLTVRLRRDVEGVRNEIYKDLYYAVTELDETCTTVKSVKYICCVAACKKNISMYVRNGFIVFENFFKHLAKEHPEYLFENDLPAHPVARATTTPVTNTLLPQTREVTRFFTSTDAKLREKLLDCTARVIAHGPYPNNFSTPTLHCR